MNFDSPQLKRSAKSYERLPTIASSARINQEPDRDIKIGRIHIKYLSLFILIFQNSTLVLMMRYTRTAQGPVYIASTAVVVMELIKLFTSAFLLFKERKTLNKFLFTVKQEIFGNIWETLAMLVPSGLYAIQNNLLYTALSHLDPATFQVTYQLKILTTALFSVWMLGKKLDITKWISLAMLMIGVILVQMQNIKTTTQNIDQTGRKLTQEQSIEESIQNPLLGLSAVLAACISSGFAGVYFEKILKKSNSSLWVRNIQLGLFGFLFSALTMLINDGKDLSEKGFFYGYNLNTWLVILNQALGGLIVAIVVKYADNILKGFATSVSIVLSGIVSFLLFDFHPSFIFMTGSMIVILAVYMYGRPEVKSAVEKKQAQ